MITRLRDIGSGGAAEDIRDMYSSFLVFGFVTHEGGVGEWRLPKGVETG